MAPDELVGGMRRHAVRVTPDALRRIRGGHPWVYDGSVRQGPDRAEPGDLGVVFDGKRRFAAIGLWDPHSPIRLRVLHHGAPTPIDHHFWAVRIREAIALRAPLWPPDGGGAGPEPATTGWRVVHGENDRLPGLVADRYHRCLVVKLDTGALEPHLGPIVEGLVDGLATVGVAIDTVILRSSRTVGIPTRLLRGRRPEGPVAFREHGLQLTADVWDGQKTGHFLDQRDNRALVGSLTAPVSTDPSSGGGGHRADVLDVFCCTGGFSVHAAVAGARSVTSVDQSPWALEAAERHVAANLGGAGRPPVEHRTIRGDAFEVLTDLGRRGRRFDLVVVDPPSFASKATDRPRALAAYRRLAQLAAEVTTPGGRLFQASCSSRVEADAFRMAVASGVAEAGRRWHPEGTSGHAVDHPIGFPQGAYLKATWGRVG